MTELPTHEHYVEPLSYQQGCEAVAETVERDSAILTDPGSTNSQAERCPDFPVIEAATAGGAEHEVIRTLIRAGEPAGTQQSHNRRGEHDLPSTCFGLESSVLPVARQLTMDSENVSLEINVWPSQAESLADPQPREREQLEQRPVAPRLIEHSRERRSFKDADPSGR
jgi:hypothetical protein